MRMYDIIHKKREGGELTTYEIHFFVQGYTQGEIPDYQASALLMAIFFRGMTQRETAALAALTEKLSPHCTVALHTQGQEIYWRYGDYADPAAQALGEQMADASGYSLTHPAPGSANAGFKDWFIARFARPGFTVEAGLGQNPLPLTQLPEIYQALCGIITAALSG